MTQGEVHARRITDQQPVIVTWKDNRLTSITPTPDPPQECKWIGPPVVDLQINGFAGVDFQQDHLSNNDLQHATRQLQQAGCGRFLFTLVTDDWEAMTARLANARKLRNHSPVLSKAIAGWHIEGPFLSSEPGFCGAHPPDKMLDPTPERIHQLRDLTGKDPLLLTFAPERQGSLEAIATARQLGILVSLGHTNAPDHILRRVLASGPTGFTHLGNGCPATLDRADNILWRALDTGGFTYGLIPDRWHVTPALFRLIHRMVGSDRIYHTTDAMSAAGSPPGKYRLGKMELEVGPEQVVRLPGTPNLAGSALRPIDGVVRAAEMLQCDWQQVWPSFSQTPAEFMGLEPEFIPGAPANFLLVDTNSTNHVTTTQLYQSGERIN